MTPDQRMDEAVNQSQPSVVTSPTQTEAIYSLAPPPNRHGVIAVVVAGMFLLAVLIAVFVGGSPDADTQNLADPAAPLPELAESSAAFPPEPAPAKPSPAPEQEPSAAPSGTSATQQPSSTPVVPRRGGRKKKSDPKPDGPYKPKTL
jgi:hypothetical protein